jgi:hypothetical protein
MLDNGTSEAATYVDQLLRAEAPPGVHILGDYLIGDDAHRSGAFIFQSGGILSGLELYGLAGDAPKSIPMPHELRRFDETLPKP